MKPVTTTVRNPRKAFKVLAISSLILLLGSFVLFAAKVEADFSMAGFPAGLALALISIAFYTTAPKRQLVLLEVQNEFLVYTSRINPYFGIGRPYQATRNMPLSKILAIDVDVVNTGEVGRFTRVKLMARDGNEETIYFDFALRGEIESLFEKVQQGHPRIQVVLDRT